MDSAWFRRDADIITYEIDELMATKLRALYQRRKVRDLFDLWYVVDRQLIDFNPFSMDNIYNLDAYRKLSKRSYEFEMWL